MDYQIGNPNNVWLAAFAIVTIVLTIWSAFLRNRAIRKFATERLRSNFKFGRNGNNRFFSSLFVTLGVVFLAIALMDIRWGKTTREVPQKGIEVMFALDVSRSMLAQDVTPSRLERAKQQINDIISEMVGDRIGLVVFAGEAQQKIPLTSHYDDFRQTLESVGPQSIPTGGSKLAMALQEASDGFINKTNDHKAIIIFTDGEDQESKPIELAKKIHEENGTRIFTIGLGDIDQGSRIPVEESRRRKFLVHNGEQVWTKLNGKILRSIATETNGAYIPAGTKHVNMADVYHSFISNVEETELDTASIETFVARYQWFTAFGLFFLILELLLSTTKLSPSPQSKKSVSTRAQSPSRQAIATRSKASAAAIFAIVCIGQPAYSEDDVSFAVSMNKANQLVRDKKAIDAIEEYSRIDASNQTEQEQLYYNSAIAHYRNGDFEAANSLFEETAKSLDSKLAAKSRHNLGNGLYAMGLKALQADPQKAIELLKKSINQFRSSLRLNRQNADARANIELAHALIQQLEQQQDQQQQDQQQQDQQQQDQQQQDQQQQDQQQQDQQQQDQQQQDQQQQDQQQQDQQQQDQQQQDQQQQDQQQQDQQQQEDVNQPNPESSDQNPEKMAEGELTADNQSEEQVFDSKDTVATERSRTITKEEAMKMLQAVRDRDLIRRLLKAQRERNRRIRVERDW